MRHTETQRIVIVGAGIVGASLAYHLARRGFPVTVVERDRPGRGGTAQSFAWINASAGDPPLSGLRSHAVADYRRLEAELGQSFVHWHGALCHGVPLSARQLASGESLERAQIAQREPDWLEPPEQARFFAEEGAFDAVALVHLLLQRARHYGARILEETEVLGFRYDGGALRGVLSSAGPIAASAVLVAAGVGALGLLETLGVRLPLASSPCLLLRLRTPRQLVRGLISNERMEVRQAGPGILLAVEDYLEDSGARGPQAIAEQTLESLRGVFRDGEEIALERVEVGRRPMPRDGLPLIGFCPDHPGVYLALMHAAATLAATLGRLVAEEFASGREAAELSAFRPTRERLGGFQIESAPG
ncbi:TPA: FAD-binding oxidoreductase [Pseudomonas aeruginosa]|nr:FAD-binding oxidoreductase [Pseudomonas aeruginosa]